MVESGVGERGLLVFPAEGSSRNTQIDTRVMRLYDAPPPLLQIAAEPARLEFLGSYAALEPIRQHVRVRQLWLWRDGDDLLALGAFGTHIAGRRAQFVCPALMGRGRRKNGGWRFAWRDHDGGHGVDVWIEQKNVGLSLDAKDGGTKHILEPGAVFADEIVDLAPSSDAASWEQWFSTLLRWRMFAADIPGADRVP